MSPNLWERCQLSGSETDGCRGGQLYRKKLSLWFPMCTVVWLLFDPVSGHAQSSEKCGEGSMGQLEWAISMHNHNSYRLDKKFQDIWYLQGPIRPGDIGTTSIKQIITYLSLLGERKSAVLFHQVERGQLSTWLITSSGRTICAMPKSLNSADWQTLDAMSWGTLGTQGAKRARQGTPLHNPGTGIEDQSQRWDKLLKKLSEILLPPEIVTELTSSETDTLIVVPITIRTHHDAMKDKTSNQRTFSLSTVPFAALPFEKGLLVNKMSVVISPGFSTFSKAPMATRQTYVDPLVIGNPDQPKYQSLPGAEAEATHVAERLGTQAFVRENATKKFLYTYLTEHSKTVDLIHLATHGIADAKDPLDGGFLVFSDSVWYARQIGLLRRNEKTQDSPLLDGQPLVIMSACQTALGKDFPSGTIGLARAWQRAGASNVVMSLWSVDDEATKELMGRFVDLVASGQAVDKALQAAMQSLRKEYPNPSNWASFSIYGAPERLTFSSTTSH